MRTDKLTYIIAAMVALIFNMGITHVSAKPATTTAEAESSQLEPQTMQRSHKESNMPKNVVKIGWATADITPDQPVLLAGQFYPRLSEGVMDPVTTTALAIEAMENGQHVIMISCELVSIHNSLRDAVRALVKEALPECDSLAIVLNATHSHTAPLVRPHEDAVELYGLELSNFRGMDFEAYVEFITRRIAETAIKAWQCRVPSGIGFGLGQAVVGRNRRMTYQTEVSRMYGNANDPAFSHVEGYEDHALNLLCTFDDQKKLTGMIVNLACPAQVSESIYLVSADFWHETRVELHQRFGNDIFILPQCSAAGDQSPHILLSQAAEARMLRLKGLIDGPPEKLNNNLGAPLALRQEIALRISEAIALIMPAVVKEIDFAPRFERISETVELPVRALSQADVDEAFESAKPHEEKYKALLVELEQHPEMKEEPRWYKGLVSNYRVMKRAESVAKRFESQKTQPNMPAEVHILRLGDVAFATNPFELYLDYGIQLKERSPAVQTFVVQLAGAGTYLPSPRSISKKGYGSAPASTPVGPEGGNKLVDYTLTTLEKLWK